MSVTRQDSTRSLTGAVWDIAPRAPAELFAAVDELPPLAVQVLHNRGHDTADKLHEFLLGPLPPHDPYLLDEMDVAVARIAKAMHERERVCIYGDYDVDGVSATAMLLETAEALGLDAFPYIPERLDRGLRAERRRDRRRGERARHAGRHRRLRDDSARRNRPSRRRRAWT